MVSEREEQQYLKKLLKYKQKDLKQTYRRIEVVDQEDEQAASTDGEADGMFGCQQPRVMIKRYRDI